MPTFDPEGVPAANLPFSPSAPPMQAREVDALPHGEDWMYEFIWGGERVRAVKKGGGVRVLSREGRDLTNRFPRVAAALAKLRAASAILDGEILYLEAYGADARQLLSAGIDDLASAQVVLLACDLLCENGRDVRQLSLLCRRVMLASAVQSTPIILSPQVNAPAGEALALAQRLGLRGIVAKRGGSFYRPNSLNQEWVKVSVPAPGAPAGRRNRAGPPKRAPHRV